MSNSRPMLDASGERVRCASCGSGCYCDPIWYSGQPQRCDACVSRDFYGDSEERFAWRCVETAYNILTTAGEDPERLAGVENELAHALRYWRFRERAAQ